MTEFQKQARSFLRAGINLLQQGARNDSDDDEAADIVEDEEYIRSGTRGVIVFKTYSVKTDKEKTLHLHLYKAQVVQYYEKVKRVYSCDEMLSINRNADNNVVIEIKKPMAIQTHIKKIIFQNEEMAQKFISYIEFINGSGAQIKQAFNAIDYKRTGIISRSDLVKALAKVDLKASQEDADIMLSIGTNGAEAFDYCDFLHLFMTSFVSNLRECLQEWLYLATTVASDPSESLAKADTLHAVSGEVVAFAPTERVHWCLYGGKACRHPYSIPGVMYVTNYRVVLFSLRKTPVDQHDHSRHDVPPFFNQISVPLSTLQRIVYGPPRNSIYLTCKDFRTLRITLWGFENNVNKVETFVQVLQSIAFYGPRGLSPQPNNSASSGGHNNGNSAMNASSNSPANPTSPTTATDVTGPKSHLFAFKNLTYFAHNEHGWNHSDLIKEYVRQGLFDAPEWQIFENRDYEIIPSYPRYLALPTCMCRDEIYSAAAFRSRNRMPAVTYLHRATGAVLTRAAQPLVGLAQKNSAEDVRLLNLYRCKGRIYAPKSEEDLFSKLYILDARGKIAATLNMAVGKGTEDVSCYQNAELIFCGIDNIHVMRSSAAALSDALTNQYTQINDMAQALQDGTVGGGSGGSGGGFFTKVEESGWLRHLRLILVASVIAAEKLHFEGASVLIHCSDGWDRTAQTCGIAQLLLDPYFRTVEGFAVLVEKEWCAFGFKFQDRCGHGLDHNQHAEERSPVFLQFLEVVYQLTVQFPTVFEFNEGLLLFLADHAHSCLFGNFLGNSEKQRVVDLEVRELTKSIWAYIFEKKANFLNPGYVAFPQPVWPSCNMSRLRIWERYWLRWDLASHPNKLNPGQWHDDWGNGSDTDPAVKVVSTSYSFVAVPKEQSSQRAVMRMKKEDLKKCSEIIAAADRNAGAASQKSSRERAANTTTTATDAEAGAGAGISDDNIDDDGVNKTVITSKVDEKKAVVEDEEEDDEAARELRRRVLEDGVDISAGVFDGPSLSGSGSGSGSGDAHATSAGASGTAVAGGIKCTAPIELTTEDVAVTAVEGGFPSEEEDASLDSAGRGRQGQEQGQGQGGDDDEEEPLEYCDAPAYDSDEESDEQSVGAGADAGAGAGARSRGATSKAQKQSRGSVAFI